jgi:hypothetical protein
MSDSELGRCLRLSCRNQAVIDAQSAEIERLKEALKPFAEAYDVAPEYLRDSPEHCCIWDTEASNKITIGDLRRARSARSPKESGE